MDEMDDCGASRAAFDVESFESSLPFATTPESSTGVLAVEYSSSLSEGTSGPPETNDAA